MQPLNTPPDVMVAQAAVNLERILPLFIEQPANSGRICIVGGAPSLKDSLPELQREKSRGAAVLSLNNTHDWLSERGIFPDLHVMLDARRENVEFLRRPRKDTVYLIAAQCHPEVFDALEGHQVIVWVADVPGMRELADKIRKPIGLIGGGSTVGLKAMMLAYLWGFRRINLFGMDSCYREGKHHAYPQALNDSETRVEAEFAGRRFVCAPWMVAQAEDFDHDARQLLSKGVRLKAHGDGLLQTILADMKGTQNAAA